MQEGGRQCDSRVLGRSLEPLLFSMHSRYPLSPTKEAFQSSGSSCLGHCHLFLLTVLLARHSVGELTRGISFYPLSLIQARIILEG